MRLMAIGLAAGLMLGGAASANVAPPPDLPNRLAAEAVEAFMENFNAGSVEGIESVLANRTDFVWPENGVLRTEGETATVADIKAALEAQPGLRLETTGLKVILLGPAQDAAEVVAPITLYAKNEKGEEVEVLKGVMTFAVAVDAEDGVWRIASGHTSTVQAAQ